MVAFPRVSARTSAKPDNCTGAGSYVLALPPKFSRRANHALRRPAAGMPLSRAQIDGQSIVDAAARAQTIFADQVGRESSLGWSSSSVQIVSSNDRAPDPEA
jgi:hypothetical protein